MPLSSGNMQKKDTELIFNKFLAQIKHIKYHYIK